MKSEIFRDRSGTKFSDIAKRNEKIILYLMVQYLAFGIIIYSFEAIYESRFANYLVGLVKDAIPSIEKTATISPNKKASELILAFSWLYSVPVCGIILKIIPWQLIDFNKIKSPLFLMASSLSVFLLGVYGFARATPDERNVHIAGMIYKLISSNIFYSVAWGFVISFLLSISAVCAACGFVAFLSKNKNDRGQVSKNQ